MITSFTRATSATITSISLPRHEIYNVLTDIPIANLTNLFIYLQPNQWIAQTNSYEDPLTPPVESYFELATTVGTVVAVQYTMPFTSSFYQNNEKNTRMLITFSNAGGFVAFQLNYYFLNTEDLMTTLNANQVQNQYRLLKDCVNNPNVVDNSESGDVYTQYKDNRLSLWISDNVALTLDFKRCQIIELNNFYEVDDITRFSDPEFSWSSCQANTLDCDSTTTVTFTAVDNITITPTVTNWFLIDVTTTSASLSYQDMYKMQWINDIATYDTNYEIPLTGGSSVFSALTGYTGLISTVDVDGTNLICGNRYRFIVVIETTTESYSFISAEFTLDNCLCLCPPTIDKNVIANYLQDIPGMLYATPQERLKTILELDVTTYNACRPTAFCDALQTVTITIYEDVLPSTRHILDVKVISRNALSVLVAATGVNFTCSSTNFTGDYEFRVRYEAGIPNIVTTVGGLSIGQLSNQDWTGRTLKIDWVFTLTDGGYNDTLTYIQGFIVDLYNEDTTNDMDFTVEDADTNLPVDPDFICDGQVSNLRICSTTTDVDGANFISGIDKEAYTISNFIEHDNFSSVTMTQLLNAAITSQDVFYTLNKACSVIDLAFLPRETNLRFVALKLRYINPIDCCGNPEFANLTDPDYLDLIDRMVAAGATMPNLARQQIIANTIQQFKGAGLWNKFDCIWLMAAHHRDAARVNWKGFASTAHDLTEVNWTANHHVVDVGLVDIITVPTFSYYDTNYVMSTNGINFTQNSATMITGMETLGVSFGILDGPHNVKTYFFTDTSTITTNNEEYFPGTSPVLLNPSVFQATSRCDSSGFNYFLNNGFMSLNVNSHLVNSVPVPQYTTHIRSLSINGIPAIGGIGGQTTYNYFNAIGGCLTDDEMMKFYQIIRCYHNFVNEAYFYYKLS